MNKTLELMQNFEKRNNISTTLIICSDGSSTLEEFWEKEELKESRTIEELHDFLKSTQYKLANDDGRCLSPVQTV